MMNQRLSPSAVLCDAAGIAPVSNAVAGRDTACAMCGIPIPAGGPVNDVRGWFDAGFNNKLDLVEGRTLVCEYCVPVWNKDWMQTYASSYACHEGVFQLRSNEDLAALLLDPPEPPFVVNVLASGNQQHLAWRGIVNLSREFIYVRFGDEVFTIRREYVLRANAAWGTLSRMNASLGIKKAVAETDAKMTKADVGRVNPLVAHHAARSGFQNEVRVLEQLSAGEWWALNALRQWSGDGVPPKRLAVDRQGRRLIVPKSQQLKAQTEAGAN